MKKGVATMMMAEASVC